WPQLSEYRPTWYTAVPTMHQAIVARAEPDGGANTAKLRFVRSASSALPPQTARGLEQIFNAPVVEAYGMTEAAHQMSCNPLPPARRKFGSVGQPAGPEIAIMDANGRLLRPKTQGEIVIRGRNVTAGYENNPAANAASFTNGWFRTGDLGRFDEDGYLFIDGRIKEIINRGGEKISPREIDEALLDHPAVLAAVTFAVPDPRLGEEIAAAVVLKKNATADEESLTRFAASRLADFKVPRRILIVDEIPKGPTGKVQRIGLAERLGLKDLHPQQPGVPTQAAPDSTTRSALARIWREVLKVREVRDRDEFLALGGDSILAAQVIARVWQQLGRKLPIHAFFGAATLTSVSAAIEAGVDNSATESVLQDIETMTDEEAERLLGGLSQTTTHGGGSR
ncbi:MAG TPA: non-ribosomal peptide synthetase, partial [Tepidisphaeraceae bacterium]|nr:non-ribosomal peptide synthetase [Tepidisphaeraceae bacterium]